MVWETLAGKNGSNIWLDSLCARRPLGVRCDLVWHRRLNRIELTCWSLDLVFDELEMAGLPEVATGWKASQLNDDHSSTVAFQCAFWVGCFYVVCATWCLWYTLNRYCILSITGVIFLLSSLSPFNSENLKPANTFFFYRNLSEKSQTVKL